jgi:hypothetical protein
MSYSERAVKGFVTEAIERLGPSSTRGLVNDLGKAGQVHDLNQSSDVGVFNS